MNLLEQKEDEDLDNLDDFFQQIDNLKISDDDDNASRVNNTTSSSNSSNSTGKSTGNVKHTKDRKALIEKADTHQKAWKTFSESVAREPNVEEQGDGQGDGQGEGRKPISFSLGKKDVLKAKKKKNKKKKAATNDVFGVGGIETETTTSNERGYRNCNYNAHAHVHAHAHIPTELRIPSWTLILDTCAILESYATILEIYKHAHTMMDRIRKYGIRHNDPVEPIQIVIPRIVWNELDYRVKAKSLGENEQFKARRAVRMLNECALASTSTSTSSSNSNSNSSVPTGTRTRQGNYHPNEEGILQIFKCQSRSEMEQSKIPSNDRPQDEINTRTNTNTRTNININSTVEWRNDDYILSCALQQKEYAEEAIQMDDTDTLLAFEARVVLITLDQVLTGKASSDQMATMTPDRFWILHKERMRSLRERERERERERTSTSTSNRI